MKYIDPFWYSSNRYLQEDCGSNIIHTSTVYYITNKLTKINKLKLANKSQYTKLIRHNMY